MIMVLTRFSGRSDSLTQRPIHARTKMNAECLRHHFSTTGREMIIIRVNFQKLMLTDS